MSCTACGTSFSFLKKEHGCKLCGFAFCGKCCNIKVIVPTISQKKKQQICKGCSTKLNNNPSNVPKKFPSPPLAFQRRMEEVGSIKSGQAAPKEASNLDKELASRLDKLKERPKVPIVSDQELRERLSKLKGIPPSPQSSSKSTPGSVAEAQVRQVGTDAELAARLQKLRARTDAAQEALNAPPAAAVNEAASAISEIAASPAENVINDLDRDEESEAAKLVQQFMEEAALDKASGRQVEDEEDEDLNTSEKEDEFPWCIICTGDAEIRCIGCSMDLYCHRCHKECHDREDLNDHKTIPFER